MSGPFVSRAGCYTIYICLLPPYVGPYSALHYSDCSAWVEYIFGSHVHPRL
jgi:hypothetical protein